MESEIVKRLLEHFEKIDVPILQRSVKTGISEREYIAGIDNLSVYDVCEGNCTYHVNGVGNSKQEALEDFASFISGKGIREKKGFKKGFRIPDFTLDLEE